MIYINSLEKGKELFEALSSPTRIRIIEFLQQTNHMNMDTLSRALGISNGALTSHIKKLHDCGIIDIRLDSIGHGTQKLCSLKESKFVVDFYDRSLISQYHELEFNVGQYTTCKTNPTCGLCDKSGPLFEFDLPQYFKYPEHFNAELLWFTDGAITYTFPNPLSENQILSEIQLTFEISGEGPFIATDFPSAIDFFNKDSYLGRYVTPGEFSDHKGKFTPDWWLYGQHGELLTIQITKEGTFINGLESAPYTINDLQKDSSEEEFFVFKISCEDRSETKGGVTLFGKNFGDYPKGIAMRVFYN